MSELRLLPLPDLEIIKYIGDNIMQGFTDGKFKNDLIIDIDFFELHKGLKVVNG